HVRRVGGVALVKEASAKEGNPEHSEVALAGHAIVRMSAGSGVPKVLEARQICRLGQVELGLLIEQQKPAIARWTSRRQRQVRNAADLPHAWDSAQAVEDPVHKANWPRVADLAL